MDGLYFRFQRALTEARDRLRRHGVQVFESDLKPSDRYLMERFVTASFNVRGVPRAQDRHLEFRNPAVTRASFRPRLACAVIDIETSGFDGELYSIARACAGRRRRVFMVSDRALDAPDLELVCCRDEREVLRRFFHWMSGADPDLILGWNVLNFDLDFLQRRCEALRARVRARAWRGRGAHPRAPVAGRGAGRPGSGTRGARRDRPAARRLLAPWRASSSSMSPARCSEGESDSSPGTDKLAEIRRLYREDPVELARYNLEDCRLVEDIFEHAHLVDFAMRRAEMTGLAMDRLGGSVAAFDHLYLPRLHRRGRVARDVGAAPGDSGGSPGGYVLDSRPGLYDDVLLLDFKSLYPSIIRTFRIDPFGLADPGPDPVPGFSGASFAREGAILPELVAELGAVREEAKAAGDAALSQAVKILMNSFYGVLGARRLPLLRFPARHQHHPPRARDHPAESGLHRGPRLLRHLRRYRLALPAPPNPRAVRRGPRPPGGSSRARSMPGGGSGSRRSTVSSPSSKSSSRSTSCASSCPPCAASAPAARNATRDWCARRAVSRKWCSRGWRACAPTGPRSRAPFSASSTGGCSRTNPSSPTSGKCWTTSWRGRLDEQLVYRKRLRRPVAEYTHNVPPHVQAAAKLARPGRWVSYVITRNGPEPVSGAGEPCRPDYEHYRERQLAPRRGRHPALPRHQLLAQITDTQLRMF